MGRRLLSSLSRIVIVATLGLPRRAPGEGINFTTTVSFVSSVASSTGVTIKSTKLLPAGMITDEGRGA